MIHMLTYLSEVQNLFFISFIVIILAHRNDRKPILNVLVLPYFKPSPNWTTKITIQRNHPLHNFIFTCLADAI